MTLHHIMSLYVRSGDLEILVVSNSKFLFYILSCDANRVSQYNKVPELQAFKEGTSPKYEKRENKKTLTDLEDI